MPRQERNCPGINWAALTVFAFFERASVITSPHRVRIKGKRDANPVFSASSLLELVGKLLEAHSQAMLNFDS